MKRREVLKWISRGLGSATAAVVAFPGMRYVIGTQQAEASESTFHRVARLSELRPGQALPAPIIGQRQDGWMVEPNQVVGRVWLMRLDDGADPSAADVAAFTSVCPHMGCQIQLENGGGHFVCPCHRATFRLDGKRRREANGSANHAPRGMDNLDCRVVQDEQGEEWWVEVRYEKFESGLTGKVPKA